ncbi:GNAT family N-acetyltransferase [Nocardioides rubriscoriae]|uniref:GNAT family N-acetyltransferase n=1 Tax=Nocardioides rubriscoriae TaxID=642762 RepID=UPI0011DF0F26|nr:GNAT family N-acetyltransferase [Nocardioides rubriscoriae]
MSDPAAVTHPRELVDGLVLRSCRPADLTQVGDLLAERGDDADRQDHRLVVEDAGYDACAIVVDGYRVVSTAVLLDEELTLADAGAEVRLPAGQVELVATDRAYEGRGLVRALMGWAHERSAARGHVVQVMIGIPYFYRQFGYSYALDVPPRLVVDRVRALTSDLADLASGHVVRTATAADLLVIQELQALAQATAQVRMPHSAPCWRWVLERTGCRTLLVERDGVPVATGRLTPAEGPDLLGEVAAVDEAAAAALVTHALGAAGRAAEPEPLRVADRPGTPVSALLARVAEPPSPRADQYYLRVPDPVTALDAVRPVLQARLDAADLPVDATGHEVVVSFFGSHVRFPVVGGRLGAPVAGGPMQAPGAVGGAGVAPDHLGALLLGPLGIDGLARLRPDVYPGPRAELMSALFPPVRSDLLTYYLA